MRSFFSWLLLLFPLGVPPLFFSQTVAAFQLTDEEKEIFDLTNAARKDQQLEPLRVNATLMKCARQHSLNMAKQAKMAHELDGKSPFDRLRAVGYDYRRAGENVAYGDEDVSVKEIFDGWMKSEGHRKNILNKDYVEIGLGIAVSGEEKYYTQVFGQPFKTSSRSKSN
jgi:uncharacterized protein YkwD